jgi:hypothetical protein
MDKEIKLEIFEIENLQSIPEYLSIDKVLFRILKKNIENDFSIIQLIPSSKQIENYAIIYNKTIDYSDEKSLMLFINFLQNIRSVIKINNLVYSEKENGS